MKYPIIVVPFLNVSGMAVYPFILIKKAVYRDDSVLIRHEIIHLKQQQEMLVLPFYIAYLASYIYYLLKLNNHNQAYNAIIFEREAYDNERDATYLNKRPFWGFLRHK